MSNTNRTAYAGPPLKGPGIMWVNSKPKPPLSDDAFNEWYQKVHIPDIIAAKPLESPGCTAAWRFCSQDNHRSRPYLALYSVPDMSFIQSSEFSRVTQYHDLLPEGGPSQKFIDFDTRFYQRLGVLTKPGGSTKGLGKVIKSTAIEPGSGMEDEFNRWYDEEHLEQVSNMPGWRRSTRFELVFKVQSKDDPDWEEAPKYLAIHEFEEGTAVKRMPREEWTAWTKKMVENATKVDEGVFKFLWGTGDEAGLC